ncbi:hypothetical protein K402DRAFT_394959 [Aulographum hederae CBS 113979]|uniref:Uncharacterized protein n=1 Tax=Aulographum hederae CBS 113979 TaxID=1176131 RepID=A0A6G1GWD1_9PEZI|nr:hypothetical protein K402DRAFT_394959 [Aulographum hederae CBS 113979]
MWLQVSLHTQNSIGDHFSALAALQDDLVLALRPTQSCVLTTSRRQRFRHPPPPNSYPLHTLPTLPAVLSSATAQTFYIASTTMGESRQELLAWLNNLLQLNITKVEQCGTGAALCQVYDSIFLDVPMSRVKFNVNSEYAYIQNFKILQSAFTKHGIERTVPVEALTKCKMQDNLEFLQWSKRYWDQYYPGGDYDALARRKASGAPAASAAPRVAAGGARRAAPAAATPRTRTPGGSGGGAASSALMSENNALKETVAGLERERDFYFSKLRDIELLIQQAIEQDPEMDKEDGLLKHIQTILYSTEEGFEIPAEVEGEMVEEETF